MRTESTGRAAVEVFGALALCGALLATPFVCVSHWLDNESKPTPEDVVSIEQSNCAQLRDIYDGMRADSLPPLSAENTLRLIERRGAQLHCLPMMQDARD